MTVQELAQAAANCISRLGPELDDPKFAVVLGRQPSGFSNRMRVLPGVMGEVACVNQRGETVVYVSALKVLAHLQRNGLVRVEFKESPPSLSPTTQPGDET